MCRPSVLLALCVLSLLFWRASALSQNAPASLPKAHPDVQALIEKAEQFAKRYQWQDALQTYEEALAKARSLQDRTGEAQSLTSLGILRADTGQSQKALPYFEQALSLYRQAESKVGEASTLTNIGLVYYSLGQMQKALDSFDQALPLHRAVGNAPYEANTLNNLGLVYHAIGQSQKALQNYEQALSLHRRVGDKSGEASALTNIGICYNDLSQPQKALEYYTQALPLHRAVGNALYEAKTLQNIGNAYRSIGQSQQALEHYEQALSLYKRVRNRRGEANALNGIGNVYSSMGQSQKALQYYEQAEPIYRQVGDKNGEATTLGNIGLVYRSTHQWKKAAQYYEQALSFYKQVENKKGESNLLNNIGAVYADSGQQQKALQYFEQALAIRKQMGDKEGEAATLTNIGASYAETGQSEKALAYFGEALPILRQVGDEEGEAATLINIGGVYAGTDQSQKALAYFEKALPLYSQVGDKGGEAATLNNMGIVYANMNQPKKALVYFQRGLELREQYREDIGADTEGKFRYLTSMFGPYLQGIALLWKLGEPEEAFRWTQKVKARGLLDEMQRGKIDLTKSLSDTDRAQERQLRREVEYLHKALLSQDAVRETKLQLAKAESALQDFRAELYRRNPDVALLRSAKTAELKDIAAFLPADTALLEYLIFRTDVVNKKQIDDTLLFLVTVQNGKPKLDVLPLKMSQKALEAKCRAFRAACGNSHLHSYRNQASDLYQRLIAPAEKRLAGKKRLLICPDGPLWGVPFQALRDKSSKHLWERFEIAYAYSATGVQAARFLTKLPKRPKPTAEILAMANPDFGGKGRFDSAIAVAQREGDLPRESPSHHLYPGVSRGIVALPNTQKEADAIKSGFPNAVIFTRKAAQEATVKREAGKYRYLHFATHGFLNDVAPMLSSIVLAEPEPGSEEDGFLTAQELFDMNLSAEMVVLSACDTAKGERRAGEGIIGLTWALFVAGCPTQVVSQWKVSDEATTDLMTAFYGNLKRGEKKGAALRKAGLQLMRKKETKHPYFWAPFILMGDWN